MRGQLMLRLGFLFLLPLHCLFGSLIQNEKDFWSEAPVPSWVTPTDFSFSAENSKGLNLRCLLVDRQELFPEQTKYCRYVVQAFTPMGMEEIAQLEIDFEPAFQKLVVHE